MFEISKSEDNRITSLRPEIILFIKDLLTDNIHVRMIYGDFWSANDALMINNVI